MDVGLMQYWGEIICLLGLMCVFLANSTDRAWRSGGDRWTVRAHVCIRNYIHWPVWIKVPMQRIFNTPIWAE